jgi:hypothetical protein
MQPGSLTGTPAGRRWRRPVAAVVGCGLVLAGCGGGKSQSTPTTHGAPAPTTRTVPIPATTISVPAYDPAKNARQDVVPGACVNGGSRGWSLAGTVTNSSPTKHGYSIVVDFITVPGDTVVATKLVTVPPLSPKASAKWSATGAAPGVKNLTCVVRQSLST